MQMSGEDSLSLFSAAQLLPWFTFQAPLHLLRDHFASAFPTHWTFSRSPPPKNVSSLPSPSLLYLFLYGEARSSVHLYSF